GARTLFGPWRATLPAPARELASVSTAGQFYSVARLDSDLALVRWQDDGGADVAMLDAGQYTGIAARWVQMTANNGVWAWRTGEISAIDPTTGSFTPLSGVDAGEIVIDVAVNGDFNNSMAWTASGVGYIFGMSFTPQPLLGPDGGVLQ